jgi:hypothetical protein
MRPRTQIGLSAGLSLESRSLILENDDLRVAVLIDYGAKMLELKLKRKAHDLPYHNPRADIQRGVVSVRERMLKVFLRDVGIRPIAGKPSCTI